MKKMLAAFKGQGFKQLAISHCEKVVMVLVVLFVLGMLAMTPFAGYDVPPQVFINKASENDTALEASVWPETEKQTFALSGDLPKLVEQLEAGVNVAKYEYAQPLYHPLHAKKEKLRLPSTVKVADLKADFGRVLVELQDEESQDGELMAETDTTASSDLAGESITEPEDDLPLTQLNPGSDLSRRKGNANPYAIKGRTQGASSLDSAYDQAYEQEMLMQEQYEQQMEESMVGMDPYAEYGGYGMEMGMGMPAGPEYNGKGFRYIAVRGTVDYKAQVEKIARALALPAASQAIPELTYVDFEVERQRAVAGSDPWSGPWEKLDLDHAKNLFENQFAKFDLEVVPQEHTEAVFTSPLPGRLAGYWGAHASHPKIRQLSLEQIALQEELNKKVLEKATEDGNALPAVEQGGFATVQAPVSRMRYQYASGMGSMMASMQEEMEAMGAGMYGDEMADYESMMMDGYGYGMYGGGGGGMQVAAVPVPDRTLLFRYFDFTVEPGHAYRYRVRLLLKNPCYGKPAEELVDPAIREQPTIATDWSEPSEPALVDPDHLRYLTDVVPESGTATMRVFQWYEEAGSWVDGEIRGLEPGQYIGSKQKALVLRPAKSTFKEEDDVLFDTSDMLLAVLDVPMPRPGDYPQLQLGRGSISIPERAVVINEHGELAELNTDTGARYIAAVKQQVDVERKDWVDLRKKRPMMQPGMEGESGYYQMMMMQMMGGGASMGSSSRLNKSR